MEFAIGRWAPVLVVDFGAAGSLVPGLGVGDLVLAEKIIEHDVSAVKGALPSVMASLGEAFEALHQGVLSQSWLQSVPSYPEFVRRVEDVRITRGVLAAGDKDIQTPAERTALAESVGAIAATWESSAVGRVARFHGVAYVSLRVITDLGSDEFLAEYKAGVSKALGPAARVLVGLCAKAM